MKKHFLVVVAVMLLAASGSAWAQQVVDTFDDVSGWNVWPGGLDDSFRQSTGPDPIIEGGGSLTVIYEPFNYDAIYFNKDLPVALDLSAEAAAGGAVSIMMYVKDAGDHAALNHLKMSTAYYNAEFQWDAEHTAAYDAGWNELLIPLADFAVSGTSSQTPTWSNITRIEFATGAWPEAAPTDVTVDIWTVTPEPASMALIGLGGLFLRRRK